MSHDHDHGHGGSEHYFGQRAETYDAGPEGRVAARFYKVTLAAIGSPGGADVLDVGCGTGRLLKLLSDRGPIRGHGLDASPEMVAVARRQCPGMVIEVGSAEALPFPDESMDLVTICLAYHHLPDRPGFLAEAARVLRPGGRLCVTEPRFPRPMYSLFKGLLRRIDQHAEFLPPPALAAQVEAAGYRRLSLDTKGVVQTQVFAR
ncbi:MAG: methyltransferase domain-containing protein [Propionibacteriaceae bacterium]|jgi:ubiquinone/menaquinone biosynthesis C-methylase UbiE|nr:methyltransferase domain-containing protein [Propionibacteriaceae bacterium]